MPLLARIRKQRVPKGHVPNGTFRHPSNVPKGHVPNGTFRHPSKKGMYP